MPQRKILLATGFLIAIIAVPFACKTQKTTAVTTPALDCTTITASYSKDIAPIITANCMPCHKAGSMKGDFTFYDGINIPAKNGMLEKRVLINKDMPPKAPLSEENRKKIRCWLDSGSPNN